MVAQVLPARTPALPKAEAEDEVLVQDVHDTRPQRHVAETSGSTTFVVGFHQHTTMETDRPTSSTEDRPCAVPVVNLVHIFPTTHAGLSHTRIAWQHVWLHGACPSYGESPELPDSDHVVVVIVPADDCSYVRVACGWSSSWGSPDSCVLTEL